MTVVRNGVKIHDNLEIPGITGGALDSNEGEPGPFFLQGDHDEVVGGGERECGREIVDVDDLHRHRRAAHAQRRTPEQDPRREALGAGADDRCGAQRGDRDVGMLVTPTGDQALDLRALHRRARSAGSGAGARPR